MITIKKAIEIKQLYLRENSPLLPQDFIDADNLSIEALKRTVYLRSIGRYRKDNLLPGETEE